MSNLPLSETVILHGVIYLKGETGYPIELFAEAVGHKTKSVLYVSDFPIFRSAYPRPQVPFSLPQEVGLSVPTPAHVVPAEMEKLSLQDDKGEDVGLPGGIPYYEELRQAGYITLRSVNEAVDLQEVPGLDEAKEVELRQWLDANVETS